MSQSNISNTTSRNISQSKEEEQKNSNQIEEAIKNISNPQTQHLNTSSQSDTKRKKFQPNDNLEKQLDEQYKIYKKFLEEIYPGNKLTKDIYCKIVSLVQNKSYHLKPPQEQKEKIESILKDFFSKEDEIPKFMKLYPDILQFQQMKDLEYKNKPEEVKEQLVDYYIKKYFRLNNLREKTISKSNHILNFQGFNQKFQTYKDYKIGKINTELNSTMKRIIRLMNYDDVRDKDFEYYLKHFKVKRIDSIFIKKDQNSTNYSLRKDDFEVFFRDSIYKNKISATLKAFGPNISFIPIKDGMEIWKQSKIYLNTYFRKAYDTLMRNVQSIYKSEKKKCNASDIKLFKEYFKDKYQFFYKIKSEFNSPAKFTYDIYYPPLVISINSEIRPYLKELCEYFNIPYDLNIDKGKAFSYNINIFYPDYFAKQTKCFKFNSYELTFNEISIGELNNENVKDFITGEETKTTKILRQKYDSKEGFVVNNKENFFQETFQHTSFKGEVFIKNSNWAACLCIYPDVDMKYQTQIKLLNEVGYIDSNFKYLLEIIEKVDLNTLNRLIEDYTMSISSRIRNTIKLISSHKEENEYNSLRELVSKIVENDENEKGKNKQNSPSGFNHDSYAEKVESDLLKYLMTLRFLKLRDYKFFVLNLINYFRYIQKRLIVDSYKMETKSVKKTQDLDKLTQELSRTLDDTTNKPKNLVINEPLSEFTKTNPIIPSLERIIENKGLEDDEFAKNYLEEIDETVEYSDKLIRIKDNKGNYIIYEASLSDMKQLEEEFCKIGTYYIQKKEKLIVDIDVIPNPFIDRTQVILDLFMSEFDFLYAKFEYISEMMTIYDNSSDIFEQKNLMKKIINVMAQRPHLDLDYNYFTPSYLMETELLRKKAAFMHILIDYQKKIEIKENQNLYETIDKYYWLLGETALEIINHVNLSKNDIETLKRLIQEKRNIKDILSIEEMNKYEDIDKFITLFTKLKKEKELEEPPKVQLKIYEQDELNLGEGNNSSSENFDKSVSKEEEDNKNNNDNNTKEKDTDVAIKVLSLMRFMKKLFSNALTGGNTGFLDENIDSLIDNKEEVEEKLKNSVIKVLEEDIDKDNKNNPYNKNISFSVSNHSLDLLNYDIRSLLNIPNPFLKDKHMNYIERNPTVLKTFNKEINFIRFEEGFPYKYTEQDQDSKINEIENFESLIEINKTFNLIEEALNQISSKFVFENDIMSNGLSIKLFDYLIEDWEKFKDKFSGKKSIERFDQVYYLQNSILDNYHSLMYTLKSVSSTLSGPINRMNPKLMAYLPNNVLDKNELDDINFITMTKPKDPNNLENLMADDLEKSLLEILKKDFKSGWLDFSNRGLDEVQIYCNCFEQYRMKNIIFSLLEKNALLSLIYESQRKKFLNTNDLIYTLKESIPFVPYKNDLIKINYLDRYYLMTEEQKKLVPKFSIQEYDKSLATCVYFKDMLTVQTNFFNRGIDELKTFASYEYMNLFLLLTATQYNNIIFFNIEKYEAEEKLYNEHKIVLKNSFYSEENKAEINKKIKDIKALLVKELFYNIAQKKLKNRDNCLMDYNRFNENKISNIISTNIIKMIYSRHQRLLLCNAYISDIALEVYLDMIKIQACSFSEHLRKLVITIPKEYNIFDLGKTGFLESEKRIENQNVHPNFQYFSDRAKIFKNFYIPSNIEILRLKNQTDSDVIYHYQKYNPFGFSDDVSTKNYFRQLEKLFYPKVSITNKLEDSRNKFFQQALSYQSNAFHFLKFCSFFIQLINIKYLEMSLIQKPLDIIQILNLTNRGFDFWGDKSNAIRKVDEKEKIPLAIIEKIVDIQKNYLNLRINFDTFKVDLEDIMKNIKSFINDKDKLINYMEQLLNYKLYHWYYLFNSSREFCLKNSDIPSFNFLTKIIRRNFFYGKVDYFKKTDCRFSCHIEKKMNNHEIFDLFKTHMYYEDKCYSLDKLYENNYYRDNENCYFFCSNQLIFNDDIKYIFPFINENKIAEIRNLDFKLASMTKNYLIFVEKSTFNTDLTTLNEEKIKFIKNYIMMQEFKYKFLIILEKDLLPIKSVNYLNLEKYMYSSYPKFDKKFIETLFSNHLEKTEQGIGDGDSPNLNSRKKNKKEEKNQSEAIKILDNKKEDTLKMKNTIVMEEFFKNSENLLNLYKYEVKYILYQNSIEDLQKENNAIRDLFASAKSDLDISKFRNRFSSNFLKELNVTQISEINQKYPFFENFLNKLHNVGIEVETHTDTNAILINRNEFDEATKILIRDFIIFDTNLSRNHHLSMSSQKFGYCFKIKKLVIWLRAYKNKLVEFDNDLEKISNAKFAISNNKLVFEMDNLYRQLKVLKDNIKVMEFYIKDYFNDKFNNLISSYQTELSQIEAQFTEFRKDIEVQLKQKITEHYNDCINRLREVTKKVNSISDVNVEQNQEFYENFDRGLTVNQSHHEELNKGRKEIENLQNDIAKLHGFYRMKMHNQRVEFENELDNLRKNLSNNQDLWDKLAIAERNETVLKEELSKTQKSLAAAEEFIKKLRGQIRNSHDKNVALEKKISQMTIKDIMRNAGKGSSAKAVELYDQIRQTYVYNMKNNVNLITAIEKIKMKYEKDEDIKILLTNFEILQKKYAEEIEAKRSFISTLNGIKNDVQKMNAISNKKLEEVTKNYNDVKKENENLKIELDKLKMRNSYIMNNNKKFMGIKENDIKYNNLSKSSMSNEKFPIIDK